MDDHLYRRVGVCLPKPLHAELVAAAEKAEVPVSLFVRQIVARAIRQPIKDAA